MAVTRPGGDGPDPQWEAYAAREPYFAILTAPRFLTAQRTIEDERAFFASGESMVSWMLAVINAGLSPQFAPVSTLEYADAANGSIPVRKSSMSLRVTCASTSSNGPSDPGAVVSAAARNIFGCVNFWYSFTENSKPAGVRSTQPRVTSALGCP